MAFQVLCVDDDGRYVEKLLKAVEEYNRKGDFPRLELRAVEKPEDLEPALKEKVDVVLADVMFKEVVQGKIRSRSRLREILDIVASAREAAGADGELASWTLPVVAYTSTGKSTLEACLAVSNRLFDIWDKQTLDPNYIAWRLGRVARELRRERAAGYLQRKVCDVDAGPSWHQDVVQMVRFYSSGWNERDQVERASNGVTTIAGHAGLTAVARGLCDVMRDWEDLARTLSRKSRGHSRHVIQVYWLGYVILNQWVLDTFWKSAWEGMRFAHKNTGWMKPTEYRDELNLMWFLAGLFHDVGGCVEKAGELRELLGKLCEKLSCSSLEWDNPLELSVEGLAPGFTALVESFDGEIRPYLDELRADLEKKQRRDHGFIAGAYFAGLKGLPRTSGLAIEAGRAMAIHNAIGAAPETDSSWAKFRLSWSKEPICCLLVLCDQLEAWDRERLDGTLFDGNDRPQRADLVAMSIASNPAGRQILSLRIDYVSERYFERAPGLLEKAELELQRILKERVEEILRHLEDWPFSLEIAYSVNGKFLCSSVVG